MSPVLEDHIAKVSEEIGVVREKVRNQFGKLSEAANSLDDVEFKEYLENLHQKILIILEEIIGCLKSDEESDSVGQSKKIINIQSLINYLEAELAWVEALLNSIYLRASLNAAQSTPVAHIKKFFSWLGGWLKKISAQLFTLLQGLMTPKEWKLSGKVGSGLLGLAEVELEITFGS